MFDFNHEEKFVCSTCGAHDHFSGEAAAFKSKWVFHWATGGDWYCPECSKEKDKTIHCHVNYPPICFHTKAETCDYDSVIMALNEEKARSADMKKQRDDLMAINNDQEYNLNCFREENEKLDKRLKGAYGDTTDLCVKVEYLKSKLSDVESERDHLKAQNLGLREALKINNVAVGADGTSVRDMEMSFSEWKRHNTPAGTMSHLVVAGSLQYDDFRDYEFAIGLLRRIKDAEVFD